MGEERGRVNVAAYCRVSTEKDDQIASLEMQKEFFEEYTKIHNYNLVELYADEGISGTKLKSRRAFTKMLEDAKKGRFERVFVKDISRFARNAVDFLQSIRELKAMGIKCDFVNSNLSTEDGEFTLGILALVAQEESANLSKRVKFGKAKNAARGKVPNLVYGYNKTKGELFELEINEREADIVREIYNMYLTLELGANKIAQALNSRGIKTKRGCKWSQNAVSRILSNPIYTGRVINGKEEVRDFLTGIRTKKASEEWIVCENLRLKVIDEEVFLKTQTILNSRKQAFNIKGERQSSRYAFSTLIKCEECGYSFRRVHRKFVNGDYIKWVCSGRNANGKDFCHNHAAVDEKELMEAVTQYLLRAVKNKDKLVKDTMARINLAIEKERGCTDKAMLENELVRLKKAKSRQTEMFEADIISLEELKERTQKLNKEIKEINESLSADSSREHDIFRESAEILCKDAESLFSAETLDNRIVKSVVEKIIVSCEGKIKVYLKEDIN